jgi:hypothetical protein
VFISDIEVMDRSECDVAALVWFECFYKLNNLMARAVKIALFYSLGSIFRARILAIACGYEDADDLDHLRKDPA